MEESDSHSSQISIALSHLKKHEYYQSMKNGGKLEDHFPSLKYGLEFLHEILQVSKNKDLSTRINLLVANVAQNLEHFISYDYELEELDSRYADLRQKLMNVVIKPGETNEYDVLFGEHFVYTDSVTMVNFLLKNIRTLKTSDFKSDQIVGLMEDFEGLYMMLTFLKPLFIHIAVQPDAFGKQRMKKFFSSLVDVLNKATCTTYSSLVGKMSEESVHCIKSEFCKLEETDVMGIYLMACSSGKPTSEMRPILETEFYLLDNLLNLFESNAKSWNDSVSRIYHDLMKFRTFLGDLPKTLRIKTLLGFSASIKDIAYQAIPVLGTCYVEEIDEDMSIELNAFLTNAVYLMELCKSEVHEIKLAKHSRTNGLGYLEYFLEYLVELLQLKWQQISVLKNGIDTLYRELHSLVSFRKVALEKHDEALWTQIVDLAYQAEYVIDLYQVNPDDSSLILSLSNIIAQLMPIIGKVIMEYLVEDKKELYVITVVEPPSSLSMSIFKASSIVQHFDIRAWCVVPQIYQKRNVLLTILGHVIGKTMHIGDLNYEELGWKLRIRLKNHRFLIILEDVPDAEVWNDLKQYLPEDNNCSRVIISSRKLQTAFPNIQANSKMHALHGESFLVEDVAMTSSHLLETTTYANGVIVGSEKEANSITFSHVPGTTTGDNSVIVDFEKEGQNITSGHVLGTITGNNDVVVGFEKAINAIMEFLVEGEKKLNVCSIVGMAGVGKTTLATSIYKAPSIIHHFDNQAWCVVSQNYQKRRLLLTILDQIQEISPKDMRKLNVESLADMLCKCLKKGRYLIVFDDIWDTDVWNYLKWYLPDNKQGSRILITTRYETIGSYTKSKVHTLCGLTEGKSWELLRKKLPDKESLPMNLLRIAFTISRSCNGLPLSIVIMAGILADLEKTEDKWNQIAKNVASHVLTDPQGKCKDILELGYNHLPDHLRSCFRYLASFPRDKEISVSHLIMLWIGEGLVQDSNSKTAEVVAQEHITDLIVRSLVIPAKVKSEGGVRTFLLHDLLHDFCLEKLKEDHFLSILDKGNHFQPLNDPHRLSINCNLKDHPNFSFHSVRSIRFLKSVKSPEIDEKMEHHGMVFLEVFDICALWHTPSYISRLVNLRYFAVWESFLADSFLISSISKLRNLQILIFKGQLKVTGVEVPDSIWDMVKLRHMYIRPSAAIQIDSNRLQNSPMLLDNLRSLSRPRLTYDDLQWLRKLPRLQRLSCIIFSSMQSTASSDHLPFELDFLGQLTSLKLETDMLSKTKYVLHLPPNLKKLTLSNLILTSEQISSIGATLPFLEVLKLYNCISWDVSDVTDSKKEAICNEEWWVNDEDFPSLKFLQLKRLRFCKWMSSEDSFPCLEQLLLEDCYDLEEIPLLFGDILTLRLISLRRCSPSIYASANEIEKMQRDAQNMEMEVHIYR